MNLKQTSEPKLELQLRTYPTCPYCNYTLDCVPEKAEKCGNCHRLCDVYRHVILDRCPHTARYRSRHISKHPPPSESRVVESCVRLGEDSRWVGFVSRS